MRSTLLRILATAAIAAIAVGGFFAAQSTRASDDEVDARVSVAVKEAVTKTLAEQKALRRKVIREVRADQKRHDRSVMRRLRLKLQESAERKSATSFQSGQSAGYSAGSADGYASGNADGYADGTEDGLEQGSDDLSCSDDPDVYWLPPCF